MILREISDRDIATRHLLYQAPFLPADDKIASWCLFKLKFTEPMPGVLLLVQ
jgi:hypothetical protein